MSTVNFIGFSKALGREFNYEAPAPLLRKHFYVKEGVISAKLQFCALGLGKAFLNGENLTDELFLSPFGDYCKTVWFNEYDVGDKLCVGENVVAVALGNGFYNENLSTGWDFDKSPWRDDPKLYFCLEIKYSDSVDLVVSDSSWLCELECSPYRFNQFRMGEIYDFNYAVEWMKKDFDDSLWQNAAILKPPSGSLRKCPAPPIKEQVVYKCKRMFKNQYGEWVFDFGQNMSGYVHVQTQQPKGTKLHIVYAEQIEEDGRRKDNSLSRYFYDGETQFCTIVVGECAVDWKPDFTYYGFRYVVINGFAGVPDIDDVEAVFVHQDLSANGSFDCSDEFLNKLYHMSQMATLSNLFNMPTDCPTREKLGWCNDAQASCEQMIQNFDMKRLYQKWLHDIVDAQKDNGELPGIVPTNGWGYSWGSGPVSNGVLFEIPYRLYQYYGDADSICEMYPTMIKYLRFLEKEKCDVGTGLFAHGLPDWAGPWPENQCPTPLEFICTVLYIRFCDIAIIAAHLLNIKDDEKNLLNKRNEALNSFNRAFMLSDGRCSIVEQTAISMIIVNKLYTDLDPLKQQLIEAVKKYDYHFHVGMVGIQYILPALDICGLNEVGYKLLTSHGYPSYRSWIDDGATTLHEMFGETMSCNHHMYSCVVAWFHNCILGIRYRVAKTGKKSLVISPRFLGELRFAKGEFTTATGTVKVEWNRLETKEIELLVSISENLNAEIVLEDGYLCNGKKSLMLRTDNTLLITKG